MLSKLLQHRKLLYGREYLFLLRFRRRYSRFISIWISGFPVWWGKIWYFSSFIESPRPVGNFHTSAINVFWSRPTLVQIKSWSKNSSFLDMTRMWKDDNITIKLSLFQSVQIFSGCVINAQRTEGLEIKVQPIPAWVWKCLLENILQPIPEHKSFVCQGQTFGEIRLKVGNSITRPFLAPDWTSSLAPAPPLSSPMHYNPSHMTWLCFSRKPVEEIWWKTPLV